MARSKYNAKPTIVDGIRFASKAEAARYSQLKMEEKAGLIKNLVLQPAFKLYVPTMDGGHEVVGKYIADFSYERDNKEIIEDVKGFKRNPVYRLKKKMAEAIYGIEIVEITRR